MAICGKILVKDGRLALRAGRVLTHDAVCPSTEYCNPVSTDTTVDITFANFGGCGCLDGQTYTVGNAATYTMSAEEIASTEVDASAAPPTETAGDEYLLDGSTPVHADWDGASNNTSVRFTGKEWVRVGGTLFSNGPYGETIDNGDGTSYSITISLWCEGSVDDWAMSVQVSGQCGSEYLTSINLSGDGIGSSASSAIDGHCAILAPVSENAGDKFYLDACDAGASVHADWDSCEIGWYVEYTGSTWMPFVPRTTVPRSVTVTLACTGDCEDCEDTGDFQATLT